MSARRTIISLLAAAVTFTVGVGIYESWPGGAPPAELLQNCTIGAGPPTLNYQERILFGIGERGTSCTSAANMTVYIKRHRTWWPDKTLAVKEGGGTNFLLTARYRCSGNGSQMGVYVEVRSGNSKVQSPRYNIAYCG